MNAQLAKIAFACAVFVTAIVALEIGMRASDEPTKRAASRSSRSLFLLAPIPGADPVQLPPGFRLLDP